MSLQQLANQLAKKGRNGDSTLVHMTKGEVAGLQALARRNGTTLTKNPETGLPEAFSLKSLIPMAAGFALGPAGFGLASSAMGAGLMVGGATALGTGSLKEGLVAGLGAYGGAGLGGAGAASGASQSVTGTGGVPVTDAIATPVEAIQAGGSAAPATQTYAGAYQPSAFSSAPADLAVESQAYAPTQTNYGAFGEAPGSVAEVPSNQYGAFGEAPPTSATASVPDAAQQQASASYGSQTAYQNPVQNPNMRAFDRIVANAESDPKLLGFAAAPAIAEELTPAPYQPEEFKGDTDMGQRYSFDSGYSNDIPGRTGPATYNQISNEEAKRIYGFADGGGIQYPYGESVMRMATGGISTLGSYSDGGRLLKGPGDGMSDNIPAKIGAKQPARLADGEFVVPADVVSHLGNGSTDAGAKQLYKMMDKIRQARTGRKAQGKQVNPKKFLPA